MINQNRRKFLKTATFCGAFFFLGRMLGSFEPQNRIFYNNKTKNRKEDGDKTVYYDNKGNKILIVEK